MIKISFKLLIILSLISWIKCWPEFHLYTQRNPQAYEKLFNITDSVFYVDSVDTKLLIHGFGDNGLTTDLIQAKNQLLLRENTNVIMVDWKDGAVMPNYLNAASNTQVVASKVALFLLANKIDPKKVHCIGHSLGAHTCGFIGKITKLKRISGLDPAGPLFGGRNSTYRLDKSDADFVDVIHVDSFYGIQDVIGHKDFFPSGGKNQPGCGVNGIFPWMPSYKVNHIPQDIQSRIDPVEIVACSHVKVPFYYAESISSGCRFTSILCNDYDSFKNNKCKCDANNTKCSSFMGYYADIGNKEGTYYLDVNKDMPFCKS